jgi:hypothetical protein
MRAYFGFKHAFFSQKDGKYNSKIRCSTHPEGPLAKKIGFAKETQSSVD